MGNQLGLDGSVNDVGVFMITAVILIKNEEKNLSELLPTLKWVDRIVVIDDDSTDKSVEVSKKYGAKIFQRSLDGDYSAQRNFGLKKVRTKWVLFIDADERVSEKLKKEILDSVKNTNEYQGYYLGRDDIFQGKLLKHGETSKVKLLRLGAKNAGKWTGKVHEVWNIKNTSTLSNNLTHESHESYSQLFDVVKKYAELEAVSRFKKRVDWSVFELLTYPVGKFFKNYFWYLGILDGLPGLMMALAMSYHSFLVRLDLMRMYYPHDNQDLGVKIFRVVMWMILLSFGLGQLMRFEGSFFGAVYGFEILMGLAIVISLGMSVIKRGRLFFPSYTWSIVLFLLVLLMSLVLNTDFNLWFLNSKAMMYWMRLVLYAVFLVVVWDAIRKKWWRVNLIKLLTYIAVWWSITGLIQYLVMPDVSWLFWYGWDDHYYRIIGLIFDPGFYGLMLVLGMILLERSMKGANKFAYGMLLVTLMLTYSRSAYLVYGAYVVLMGMGRKSFRFIFWRLLAAGLMIAFLMMFVPVGGESVNLKRTYSINSRARSVVTAFDVFNQNKIFGIGFNRYPDHFSELKMIADYHPSSPDNSYLLIMATAGVVGLISMMIMLAAILNANRKNLLIISSMIVVMLHSMMNNSMFYVFVMLWMILLLASAQKKRWFVSK